MRILFALTCFAIACGSGPSKKESSIVQGAEASPTCCCKTVPLVGEKEIVPNYNMTGRMECSGANGECVDDVQCNTQEGETEAQPSNDGVPPPPTLEPSTTGGVVE